MMQRAAIWSGVFVAAAGSVLQAQDRRTHVLNDRTEVEAAGDWIYNDLEQGRAEARKPGKPMLVLFRCIP